MNFTLPLLTRVIALTSLFAVIYLLGDLHGERVAGEKHIDYVNQQAAQTIKVVKAQQVIVTQTQVKYRDRIKTIFIKGDEIEKTIHDYISLAANAGCTINAGFVRVHDAAWASTPPGAAGESDGEPAGVSLAEVAEVNAHNAKACVVWREQVFGWREYYDKLKALSSQQSN